MDGLVPRFELDAPRVNSEAPTGLIKKTSTKMIEMGGLGDGQIDVCFLTRIGTGWQ